ncbi:MAG: DMT family transporter [Chloroflexi bacterium]|nr:DMT family transporter [Chloroflexota bacterium]
MSTPLLAAVLALLAATFWGAGDFTGGLATRRFNALSSVLIIYSVGLIALVVVVIVTGERLPSAAVLGWGALAGLLGMIGIAFLFRGFATGRMGIVAPVSAVLTASLPVVFNMFTEGLPTNLQFAGFGIALVGIWLLSRPEAQNTRPGGLGMAILAGLGFGGFFIALDQVGEDAVFWPLVAGRVAACTFMAGFLLITRRPVTLRQSPLRLLTLAGLLDVAGNLFFLMAVQNGRLDVTSVLASLYPAVTAILAMLIIKEHLTLPQRIGIGTAVLAIVLITL